MLNSGVQPYSTRPGGRESILTGFVVIVLQYNMPDLLQLKQEGPSELCTQVLPQHSVQYGAVMLQ